MTDKRSIEKTKPLPLIGVDEALLTLIPSIKTSLPVRVSGKVEKANDKYDQWIYGELSGIESRLSFRIPKKMDALPLVPR
jgi:hypothetical protein